MVAKESVDNIDHDPTKNVLDLVKAESKYQDGMRNALGELQTFARESESKMQNLMRNAETNRIDQLAGQRQIYEAQIANMLAKSVETTSNLVSTQLVQIQSTFDARVSKLEEYRLKAEGKSSVADPALASQLGILAAGQQAVQDAFQKTMREHTELEMSYMVKMSNNIEALQTVGTKSSGRDAGRREVIAWIVAAGMFIAALIYPLFQVLHATAK